MDSKKTLRRVLLSLSLAAGAFALPAYAQISFNINIAPPPPQHETVPAVAPGYVWAPGYWGWTGERHVWVRGRPILQREGYRWAPDRWDQRNNGYYRTAGHWENDGGIRPGKMKKEKKEKKEKKQKHENEGRGGGDRGHGHGHGNAGKHRD